MPSRVDGLPAAKAVAERADSADEDDEEEETFKLTIEGDSIAVEMAKARVMEIVSQHTAQGSKRIRSIPARYLPLLKTFAEQLQQQSGVAIALSASGLTVKGDRALLPQVIAALEAKAAEIVRV